MALNKNYGQWLNFWTFQLGGWGAYFIFSTLGSIEAFQSISRALFINGMFSVYGFLTTWSVRELFKAASFRNKSFSHLIITGSVLSLILSGIIVVVVNLFLLSYRGITVSEATMPQLFEGTFKFLFVFLGWTGLYLGGKFWKDLQDQKEEYLKVEAANKEIQLQMLRSQLNPHFLFNTMNSISALISEDPEKAEMVMDKFSELLRKSLSTDKPEWITLKEEIELIENYLLIEKIRFEDKIDYEIALDEEAKDVKIPTFLLYPLVENAVKYGQKTSSQPLSIGVKARCENGHVQLQCINSGNWLQSADGEGGLGIGLKNVKNRLQLAFDENQEFHIHEGDQEVIVEIKFRQNGDR